MSRSCQTLGITRNPNRDSGSASHRIEVARTERPWKGSTNGAQDNDPRISGNYWSRCYAAQFSLAKSRCTKGRSERPLRPPVPQACGRLTRAAAWTNRNSKNLLLRHILVRHTIRQREEECETQTHRVRSRSNRFQRWHAVTPNPSIERTRSGSSGLAFISFWAKPAPPPRAAHVKR